MPLKSQPVRALILGQLARMVLSRLRHQRRHRRQADRGRPEQGRHPRPAGARVAAVAEGLHRPRPRLARPRPHRGERRRGRPGPRRRRSGPHPRDRPRQRPRRPPPLTPAPNTRSHRGRTRRQGEQVALTAGQGLEAAAVVTAAGVLLAVVTVGSHLDRDQGRAARGLAAGRTRTAQYRLRTLQLDQTRLRPETELAGRGFPDAAWGRKPRGLPRSGGLRAARRGSARVDRGVAQEVRDLSGSGRRDLPD